LTNDNRLMVFFAGIGLGVAGTLLLAPASGKETRSRIRSGGDYLKQQANTAVEQGKQAFQETVSKGLQNV
jgi:gas vesicle protein